MKAEPVTAYDLTFSAPKSVSVLFAVGDAAVRAAVRESHDAAVRDAVGYLEREACVTRRGAGGRVRLRGAGVLVVDEAGMVGTRDLAEILEHAGRTKAKVVLLGDDGQLPELDAGARSVTSPGMNAPPSCDVSCASETGAMS